jgi:hypothetical protein
VTWQELMDCQGQSRSCDSTTADKLAASRVR